MSTDAAAKPTVEFNKPFTVKKTANDVVTAGTGEKLAKGQNVSFDYVLIDARTGKEVQTSWGQTPASLVLDTSKTTKQLVVEPHRGGGRQPGAGRDRAQGRTRQATQRAGRQEERHAAVRHRRQGRDAHH